MLQEKEILIYFLAPLTWQWQCSMNNLFSALFKSVFFQSFVHMAFGVNPFISFFFKKKANLFA